MKLASALLSFLFIFNLQADENITEMKLKITNLQETISRVYDLVDDDTLSEEGWKKAADGMNKNLEQVRDLMPHFNFARFSHYFMDLYLFHSSIRRFGLLDETQMFEAQSIMSELPTRVYHIGKVEKLPREAKKTIRNIDKEVSDASKKFAKRKLTLEEAQVIVGNQMSSFKYFLEELPPMMNRDYIHWYRRFMNLEVASAKLDTRVYRNVSKEDKLKTLKAVARNLKLLYNSLPSHY